MPIQHVAVFGVGAAGANTFMHILYTYPGLDLTVVDDDIVEARNVDPGTQPYMKSDLRRPKVQSIQRIATTAKNKRVNAVKKRITNVSDIRNIVENPESVLILDTFDNAESRNLFALLDGTYSVLHIGFSAGLTGEAVWNGVWEPMTPSPRDAAIDVCEMGLARPFIFALTALAGIVISRFIEKGEKVNMYFDSTLKLRSWT